MIDLAAAVADWPVGAAAVAVVDDSGVVAVHGRGAEYRWASVTKIVTAIACLEAAADGEVSLDDPVGPPGATLRHLLGHASGLDFGSDAVLSEVGRYRTYSNRGYEVAAAHVAAATGRPFATELHERVLGPLGMSATTLAGSPAADLRGPVEDLAALAAELLHPRVMQREIVAQLTTVAFPGLRGVLPGHGSQDPNDWGLGCEIRDGKDPHWTSPENSPATFGHFGQSGSFLWVDPVAGVGCVSLADRDFGDWSRTAWPVLSTAVLRDAAAHGGPQAAGGS